MGALTSKPFSFTARSWELSDRISYDFNDTFFSPIKVSFRGNSVIRVLPELSENLLFEWISDRVRFSYDTLSSNKLYDYFKNSSILFNASYIIFFCKRFVLPAYSSFSSYIDLANLWRLKNINFFLGFPASPYHGFFDFRNFFFTDYSKLTTSFLSTYKFFFFIGINLRYALPVLAVSFRKIRFYEDLVIFNFGFFTNNLLGDVNIGFSFKTLFNFFKNSSRFSKFISANSNQIFILSTPNLSKSIFDVFYYLSPAQLHFVFFKPINLSSAELNFEPFAKKNKNFSFLIPHPFRYISYNIRFSFFQKFNSIFSTEYFGNTSLFFGKALASNFFTVFTVPFNFFVYIPFSYFNFYGHVFNNSFNLFSLNLLVSAKRQIDNRSSFQYYN